MVTEVIFPVNRLPVSWQSFVAAEESYLGKWLVGAKPICSFRPFPQDSVICVLMHADVQIRLHCVALNLLQHQHVLGKW